MLTRVRSLVAALMVGTALVLTPMAADSASAQRQTGLVNVDIGNVNVVRNVGVGVAAQVAANICGVQVGNVALIAVGVIQNQEQDTVCEIDQDGQNVPVTISPA